MKNLWNKIRQFFKDAWAWFTGALDAIRRDLLYHFIAGLLIAALFGITLRMGVWAFVPALFVGFIKEFIDGFVGGAFDWKDLAATVIGGAVISLCYLLAL